MAITCFPAGNCVAVQFKMDIHKVFVSVTEEQEDVLTRSCSKNSSWQNFVFYCIFPGNFTRYTRCEHEVKSCWTNFMRIRTHKDAKNYGPCMGNLPAHDWRDVLACSGGKVMLRSYTLEDFQMGTLQAEKIKRRRMTVH